MQTLIIMNPLNLHRRVNVLIYLNRDWQDEYDGALELWDSQMQNAAQTITPHYNPCVVFTASDSYHGNPTPVNHPDQTPRRSIALYYYKATWDDGSHSHTTQFKPRPDSQDTIDWRVKTNEILTDIPPIITRKTAALKHKHKLSKKQ